MAMMKRYMEIQRETGGEIIEIHDLEFDELAGKHLALVAIVEALLDDDARESTDLFMRCQAMKEALKEELGGHNLLDDVTAETWYSAFEDELIQRGVEITDDEPEP